MKIIFNVNYFLKKLLHDLFKKMKHILTLRNNNNDNLRTINCPSKRLLPYVADVSKLILRRFS